MSRPTVSALLVGAIVLLSRLPFLGPGYGTDPDAWRAAWAAEVIATTGRYEASRFPGNPVHEIASAAARRGGPLALAGLTAFFSALAAAGFTLALARLGARDPWLGGLALAATPALYLASVQSMDYAWTLAFALLALVAALDRRAVAAGVLAGLAIGCRLVAAGWLLPLALALYATPAGRRGRAVAVLSGVALAVGAAAYLPVAATYGLGFLRFYQSGYPGPFVLAKQATVDLFGIPGTIAILLAAAAAATAAFRGRGGEPEIPRGAGGRLPLAWAAGIACFVAAWLRLPIKAYYLIPVVPLALLLLAHWAPRRAFVVACVGLLVSPWVLKLSQEGRLDAPEPVAGTVPLRVLGQPLVIDLLRGPILTDHARRVERTRYVDAVLERARALPGESVIVAWDWLPEIRVRLGGKRQGRVSYDYLPDAETLDSLRRRGVRAYSLAGADAELRHVHGVDAGDAGVAALDVAPRPR